MELVWKLLQGGTKRVVVEFLILFKVNLSSGNETMEKETYIVTVFKRLHSHNELLSRKKNSGGVNFPCGSTYSAELW